MLLSIIFVVLETESNSQQESQDFPSVSSALKMISKKETETAERGTNYDEPPLSPIMYMPLISSPRTTVGAGSFFEDIQGCVVNPELRQVSRIDTLEGKLSPLNLHGIDPNRTLAFPYTFSMRTMQTVDCTGYNSTLSILESALDICDSRNVTARKKQCISRSTPR